MSLVGTMTVDGDTPPGIDGNRGMAFDAGNCVANVDKPVSLRNSTCTVVALLKTLVPPTTEEVDRTL